MEPVTLTAAAVGTAIATTLATKPLEKTGEKLGKKAFDEAGKFIVLLRSKSPSTATAIELAEKQPLDYGKAVSEVQETAKKYFEVAQAVWDVEAAAKADPILVEVINKLTEALKSQQPRERIRDLIKNPLRLALLCKTWKTKEGELPKTKATLYQRFRDDFYKWKENEFPTERKQRQGLNAALGRLALAAIQDKLPLRESVAYEQMGESWFKLARDLGWLNLVYRDAETDEPVYAFFYLTFQEYFAACAIPGWDYFLNHVLDNPTQGTYRIFEPQWREVILLWLGQPEEEVPKKQKEQFIEALSGLEDGCKGFYKYRAYFLAAAGIVEFGECLLADQIVAQIVKWGFGYMKLLHLLASEVEVSMLILSYYLPTSRIDKPSF